MLLPALGCWLLSRLVVAGVSLAGGRALGPHTEAAQPGFGSLWNHWDVGLFVKVARYGWHSPAYADQTDVDYPGMPLAMRLVHLVLRNWVDAGLVVSLLAGGVTVVALARLAADEPDVGGGAAAGQRAVLAVVAAPYAVFLFAGYSEGLFLACVTAGWLCAKRGRWAWAGLLGAGAVGTRVIGLAFLAALVVEYATRGARPRWRDLPWLGLPLVPVVAFTAYLRGLTGHWDAYARAMRAGWGREISWPWVGLRTTWREALDTQQVSPYLWFWRAEVLAVALGVVLTVALLRRARWGEATYVGACTVIMASSSYWASGVRAALVWFPLYLWLSRHPAAWRAYLWVSAPLCVVFVLAFTSGAWVD